jgi:lipid A oxidase
MSKTFTSYACALAISGAVTLVASQACAEMAISAYGGAQSAPHSTVDVTGPTAPISFTAGWEGKSFSAPQYWGLRGTWWMEDVGQPNLGISLDYTHAKIYADGETLGKTGWSHFEFTDGLNLLTLNALYRFPIENSRFTPYVGAGAGINVPHVEVTRSQGTTASYQFGGATIQAQAGVDIRISERWSAFAEYKGNYSWINTDIDSGDKLKTNIMTNAVNFGITYRW